MMKRKRKHDSIRREKRWNESEIKIDQLQTGQKQRGRKTRRECTKKMENN